jgi:hypothetical protein
MLPDPKVELCAVVVAVTDGEPRILTVGEGVALPAGPLGEEHATLELGLRAWVEARTHHPLGYVEQLYAFGDPNRIGPEGVRTITLSYLALTREAAPRGEPGATWRRWYDYFPWEDRRAEDAAGLRREIDRSLLAWAREVRPVAAAKARRLRAASLFGWDDHPWNEDLALQRYELLFEAGCVPEAARRPGASRDRLLPAPGRDMIQDHRRILATGVSRLRAKIRYRPVVFELLAEEFTLLDLQRVVEALAGGWVHKGNFRRLVEEGGLVEETGRERRDGPGRPARLVRFRRAILLERAIAGTRPALARPG